MPSVWLSDDVMEVIEAHREGEEAPTRTLEGLLKEPNDSSGLDYDDIVSACQDAIRNSEPIEAVSGRH